MKSSTDCALTEGSVCLSFTASVVGFRNEFSSQLHRFMAHLTDSQGKAAGHTVLYVPDEGPKMNDSLVHKDKELVQRLEGEVMVGCSKHWLVSLKLTTCVPILYDALLPALPWG